MPRGDGTGRDGAGAMTGRGLGYCAGYDVPGYMHGGGFGFGRRRMYGRGYALRRGIRFAPPLSDPYEREAESLELKYNAELLEQELKRVKSRLVALQQKAKGEGDEA